MLSQSATALSDLMVLKKVVELHGRMIQIINRDERGVRVTIKAQRKE
jgi:nitrogen fixation/metabolism regulation signal transduction histidine kinase